MNPGNPLAAPWRFQGMIRAEIHRVRPAMNLRPVHALLAALLVIAAPIAQAKPATKASKSKVSAYSGRFESGCDKMAEGMYTRDQMDLRPSGPQVLASYHKAFYDQADCPAAALMATLHLPPATWTFDGQAVVEGQRVDRVTVSLTEGLITATAGDRADRLRETDDSWVLVLGQEPVPISKQSPASNDKDLRSLVKGRLLIGDPDSAGADGYPRALMKNHPLIRQEK